MIVDLLTLIGVAFFIKIFFNGIIYFRNKKDRDQEKSSVIRKRLVVHSVFGLLFMVLGRLYVLVG